MQVLDEAAHHLSQRLSKVDHERDILIAHELLPMRLLHSLDHFGERAFRDAHEVREGGIGRLFEAFFQVRFDRVVRIVDLIVEFAVSA